MYSLLITAFGMFSLIDSSLAFNAKTDACKPAKGTFPPSSGNYAACTSFIQDKDFSVYDCGKYSRFSYNVPKDQVRVINQNSPVDGEFTMHARCIVRGKSVADFDLFTPVKANTYYSHYFKGMGRSCNPKDPDTQVRVWQYKLTLQELGKCGQQPVTPIS